MSSTLYRKYRPNTFSEIVDQNHVKITLQKAVETNKISHAYLFTGPRGVGKTTTARIFAKAVNCLDPIKGEPCNKCDICLSIGKGNFLDMIELDAASRRKIDEIKEFKEYVKYPPNIAKYKVFIIDEVHMLTDVSFNALLKTLEEPPEYAIFVLCTTVLHKIPETIISRCQRYDFKKLSIQNIIDNLQGIANAEKLKIDEKILQTIAQISEGCLRDAQSLFGQIIALGDENITWEQASLMLPRSNIDLILQLWNFIVTNQVKDSVSLINKLINDGVDVHFFMDEFIEFVRKLLLIKVDKQLDQLNELISKEKHKEIVKQLELIKIEFLTRVIKILLERKKDISHYQLQQLALELAIIEISNINENKDSDQNNDKNDDNKNNSGSIIDDTGGGDDNIKETTPEADAKLASEFNGNEKKFNINLIINAINRSNFSLAGILKESLISLENNNLEIVVSHNFHKDQIEKQKNYELLVKLFKEKFSLDVDIKVEVNLDKINNKKTEKNKKEIPKPENLSDNYVDDIINAFGGRVVESGVIEE